MSFSSDSSPILDAYTNLAPFHKEVRGEDLFDQLFHHEEELEVQKPKVTYGRAALHNSSITTESRPLKSIDPNVFKSPKRNADEDSEKPKKKVRKTVKATSKRVKKESKKSGKTLKEKLLEAYQLAAKRSELPDWDYIDQQEMKVVDIDDRDFGRINGPAIKPEGMNQKTIKPKQTRSKEAKQPEKVVDIDAGPVIESEETNKEAIEPKQTRTLRSRTRAKQQEKMAKVVEPEVNDENFLFSPSPKTREGMVCSTPKAFGKNAQPFSPSFSIVSSDK